MTEYQQRRHHLQTMAKRIEYLVSKSKGKPSKAVSFMLSEIAALRWAITQITT